MEMTLITGTLFAAMVPIIAAVAFGVWIAWTGAVHRMSPSRGTIMASASQLAPRQPLTLTIEGVPVGDQVQVDDSASGSSAPLSAGSCSGYDPTTNSCVVQSGGSASITITQTTSGQAAYALDDISSGGLTASVVVTWT